MTSTRLLHPLTALLLATAGFGAVHAAHAADATPPAAAATVSTSIAAKHAITHEDVWLMKRVGAPMPSPDGKWAVFAVTDTAYDSKEQWSDLWIKSLADDSAPRRLTFSKGGEGALNWSPDSKQLIFVAKRDGDEASQIYRIDVAGGGEAQRLTTLTLGARSPKFSPDGKQILFVSDLFPGNTDEESVKKTFKERKDRKYSARAYETFPPRFFDKWLDDKQVRLFVMDAQIGAKARDILSGSKLAAMPGFGGGQGDEGQSLDAIWAPDGKSVVFSASTNRDELARASAYTQIFSLPATGGEATRLTADKHSYSSLKFSPDGKTLLCLTQAETEGKVYDLDRLASFSWPLTNPQPKILTAALDRSISRYALPSDGKRIYFTFEHAGLEQLHSIGYAGGEVKAEASAPTGSINSLNAGGAALVGVWESAINPPEVFAFNGKGPKRLTSFNVEKAASIDWQAPEHFWFKTPDGRQIHNMIVKPANFDPNKKYPLFAVIHGGAANMWRDQFVLRWNYHLLAKPGYIVLLTDYKGSTGYGEAFARSIQFDPLKGPGDEINQAVDEAIKKYGFIDGSKLAAGGASYGGHLANWLQATTTRYKAIVSHAGEMDLVMQWGTSDSVYGREVNSGGPVWSNLPVWRDQSPIMQAGNHEKGTGFKTPILITVGELDYRVPVNNALMNFAAQQRLNTPSKLVVFPDENHWVLKGENSRYFYNEVHGWLAKYLK
jgi:dipeptidyl aminopeptidase/acylaminoacyl peptidase